MKADKRPVVALFGGSFNPPHVAHLFGAVYARSVHGAEQVWLVPTFRHPLGKELVPYEHRVRMCELAVEGFGPWLQVSRAEESVGKSGRTVELLEWLLPRHPEHRFVWVLGSDILPELDRWKDWNRIQELVEVLVLARAGHPMDGEPKLVLPNVSSTEVREALAAGSDGHSFLPRRVAQYIAEKQLYARSSDGV